MSDTVTGACLSGGIRHEVALAKLKKSLDRESANHACYDTHATRLSMANKLPRSL
ncbi:MAG: hypothetical protein AAGI24_12045 [Pseudomonadota bacterium]